MYVLSKNIKNIFFRLIFLKTFYTLKNCMSEFSQCSKTKDDKYNREEERINRKLESIKVTTEPAWNGMLLLAYFMYVLIYLVRFG